MLKKPLDLRLKSDYDPWIVGQNIAKATNLAIQEGFSISQSLYNIKLKNNKWVKLPYYSYISPLGAVLYYTNSTFINKKNNSKLAAVAYELGVDVEWVMGFNSVGITYHYHTQTVQKICKRKSKKGQYARDGVEIGYLFKYAYNSAMHSYIRTGLSLFETHSWQSFEHADKIKKLGINPYVKIFKCNKCSMYGAIKQRPNTDAIYTITNDLNSNNYVADKFCFETCEELMIRGILE